jgi:hypothetical protein
VIEQVPDAEILTEPGATCVLKIMTGCETEHTLLEFEV